jgi:hypothetical protein
MCYVHVQTKWFWPKDGELCLARLKSGAGLRIRIRIRICIKLSCWIGIWIRIQNADPDPEGQKLPTKIEKSTEFSCFEVLDVLGLQNLNSDPGSGIRIRDPGSGSVIRKNAGSGSVSGSVSGSAINQCGSATLVRGNPDGGP